MQREEFCAALDGAEPAVEAAWAKVARAVAAMRAASHRDNEADYAAAWQAWQQASAEYEQAMGRFHRLLVSLIPAVVWGGKDADATP